jgi:phosphonate transport system substrate-binding protein
MQRNRFVRIIILIILPLFFSSYTAQAVNARPLVVGSVNEDPIEEIQVFAPFARYLAEGLADDGITSGQVKVAKNMDAMIEMIRAGEVDLYIDSPFPAVNVAQKSGGKLLLRRWKGGVSEYSSVVFVRADSAVKSIEDLRGKMVSFEEPWSSSAFFLPKLSLVESGFRVTEKTDFQSSVEPDEIGYIFSTSDKNTMLWVLRKRVVAGAMDEAKMKKRAGMNYDDLRVIYKTSKIPRHVVVHRGDLDPALVTRIKDILLNMEKSENGKAVLQGFEATTRFDEIPEQSLDKMIKGIHYMNGTMN